MTAAYLSGPVVKPPKRRGGCTGKNPYYSESEARLVARGADHPRVSAYKCKHCLRWHITSHPKK